MAPRRLLPLILGFVLSSFVMSATQRPVGRGFSTRSETIAPHALYARFWPKERKQQLAADLAEPLDRLRAIFAAG